MVMLSTLGKEIPDDVKKQKEAADKLLEDFEKGAAAGTPGGSASEAPLPAPPAPEQHAEDVETLKKQVENLTQALTHLQALVDENGETWRHKYDVINGKYKAEIQPMAARIRELEEEIVRLKGRVPLNEEESALIEDLGVDEATIHRMKKIFRPSEEPPAEPAPSQPKVDAARTAYFTLLDVRAKGWREAVNLPEFTAFLNEYHESVGGQQGRSLMEVLVEADANSNAETVARVYNAFFKLAASAPSVPEKPSREAAPTSSRGGRGFPVGPQPWTVEQIQQFENDVATGKIKMGSEEYKKLKASRDAYLDTITVSLV